MIHLDTSVLIDAFTGLRRSLPAVRRATQGQEVMSVCSIVLFEWLRGPRTDDELQAVETFFETDVIAGFGAREARLAADLYRQVPRTRSRSADLAIAACAMTQHARLWTLNQSDFQDIPGLQLYP